MWQEMLLFANDNFLILKRIHTSQDRANFVNELFGPQRLREILHALPYDLSTTRSDFNLHVIVFDVEDAR